MKAITTRVIPKVRSPRRIVRGGYVCQSMSYIIPGTIIVTILKFGRLNIKIVK